MNQEIGAPYRLFDNEIACIPIVTSDSMTESALGACTKDVYEPIDV